MADGEGGLTWRQEKAIVALMSEPTVGKAAKKAGVGTRTLERWIAEDEAFVAAFRKARRRALERAVAQLQHDATAARKALRRNVKCGDPHAEIRAARSILDYGFKGEELFDVVALLEEAERLDRDGE